MWGDRGSRTRGSGASVCWHMTQGTPVSSETAIPAAHRMYAFPAAPYAESMLPYSFSICPRHKRRRRQHERMVSAATSTAAGQGHGGNTCDRMMGPPWDA